YPQSMSRGSLYFECLGEPKNGDMKCSDVLVFDTKNMDAYFWDHRHYYDIFVTGFGISGCTDSKVGKEPPTFSRLSRVV
ncbi:hypothetical protein PFISCL1PPCAC_2117, partial [Pristionchus fissidentatus]